jgi:uncharacterized phosphosugar-binding protein
MFADRVTQLLQIVATNQADAVRAAADLVTTSLRAKGVLQAFGSGHSEAIALELAGRAGGLVPTNRLSPRDLVLYGGDPPEILTHDLERDPAVAHRVYALAPIKPADVFVLISNSGINGSTVELALLAKNKGHPLIAITSVTHSTEMTPRHPSGRKLMDLADVVLDNHAPYGDAMLSLPSGVTYGAVSTITSALIAQMLVEQVVLDLTAVGALPPVYLSANMAGGDEHNHALEASYEGRIRRGA